MELKESYRVLELEIGASRVAVDAAYCRLIEHWHPDSVASRGPEAVREAQRMVEAINEAYHTLAKISPNTAAPAAPSSASASRIAALRPTPPKLSPLAPSQPAPGLPPPPRPPPPETWAARSAPPASAAPPPPPPSTPSVPTSPPAKFAPPQPAPSLPPATASAPPPAPAPAASPAKPAAPRSVSFSDMIGVSAFYDSLFPPGTPRRRFGPVAVVAALVLIVLLGKCAFSSRSGSSSSNSAHAPDPKTTGSLMVKSNRANTTFEAVRVPPPGSAATASVDGTVDQVLSGLSPGKYNLTAKTEGWPDLQGEATVDAQRTTEIAMNFKSGSLRLDSDPEGAVVRLGTAVLGRTPLVVPQLAPGECLLSLEYPAWPAVPFKTTIAENVESSATVRLPHGKLIVETTLPGTMVLVAGKAAGQTPLTLEKFPAGTRKVTLQAKDFPPLEVLVKVEDNGETKIHPVLGSVFPVLNPTTLLRAIWIPDNEDQIAPLNEGVTGPFQSRNGVVKNLNRKWLFENWMRRRYCFTGIVKAYDPASGQVEFTEQPGEFSKFRIVAIFSAGARSDPDLAAQLTKGASFGVYGRLTAVEEPRWPSKVIMFELSSAEPLR